MIATHHHDLRQSTRSCPIRASLFARGEPIDRQGADRAYQHRGRKLDRPSSSWNSLAYRASQWVAETVLKMLELCACWNCKNDARALQGQNACLVGVHGAEESASVLMHRESITKDRRTATKSLSCITCTNLIAVSSCFFIPILPHSQMFSSVKPKRCKPSNSDGALWLWVSSAGDC